MLKFPHKICMVGCQEIDQHLFLIAGFILLHRIHKLIKTAPAAPFNIIFPPPIDNHLFLGQVNAIALLHMGRYPFKLLVLNQFPAPLPLSKADAKFYNIFPIWQDYISRLLPFS